MVTTTTKSADATQEIILTPQQRTAARRAAGCRAGDNAPPVRVVRGGALAPRLLGESYYWTTLSGKTIVRHPNAYGWPTWYHGSTRRVLVGEGWVREHAAR